MKLSSRITLAQMTSVTLGASLVVYISLWLIFFFCTHGSSLLWLLPPTAAGAVMLFALSKAKEGIRTERWSQSSIDAVRVQLDNPIWWTITGVLTVLAFAGSISSLIFIGSKGPHHPPSMGGFLYFWLSPLLMLSQLRGALRPPAPKHELIWKNDLKPIVSDHWGESQIPNH